MRVRLVPLLLAAACAAAPEEPQLEKGLPIAVLDEMRRHADAPCPVPPALYPLDGTWYVGSYGTVVAVDERLLAVRVDNPKDWPREKRHLLMPVSGRKPNDGIKGDAVVVGEFGELLICRFFRRPEDADDRPVVGDEVWVDYAGSRALGDARWSDALRRHGFQ